MVVTTSRLALAGWAVIAVLGFCSESIWAADPENCLSCHRYRGLARLDESGETINLYYVEPNYYDRALGPHARVSCTGCHDDEEVGVIPHRETSPVDCTQTCHLSGPDQFETVFAHDGIAAALEGSIHTSEVLDKANELLGAPLAEGQARCLLCHDEPTFRWEGKDWIQQEARIGRCNVCHTEELPKDTQYYFWHVHARSLPSMDFLTPIPQIRPTDLVCFA